MINDTKNLFKGAVRNSLKDINRESFDNIRIGTVVSSINNSKYLTVRINKTGEIINNVLIPKGGFEVETGDIVTILCPDIRNRTQNFIINAYGSKTKYSSNDYLESPTINTPIIQFPTITGMLWNSYTPSWTNVTLNNATVSSDYVQIGSVVFYKVKLLFGSSTSFTGNVSLSLPINAATEYTDGIRSFVGEVTCLESGVADFAGLCRVDTTSTARPNVFGSSNIFMTPYAINSTQPFTWGVSDILFLQMVYESA